MIQRIFLGIKLDKKLIESLEKNSIQWQMEKRVTVQGLFLERVHFQKKEYLGHFFSSDPLDFAEFVEKKEYLLTYLQELLPLFSASSLVLFSQTFCA